MVLRITVFKVDNLLTSVRFAVGCQVRWSWPESLWHWRQKSSSRLYQEAYKLLAWLQKISQPMSIHRGLLGSVGQKTQPFWATQKFSPMLKLDFQNFPLNNEGLAQPRRLRIKRRTPQIGRVTLNGTLNGLIGPSYFSKCGLSTLYFLDFGLGWRKGIGLLAVFFWCLDSSWPLSLLGWAIKSHCDTHSYSQRQMTPTEFSPLGLAVSL